MFKKIKKYFFLVFLVLSAFFIFQSVVWANEDVKVENNTVENQQTETNNVDSWEVEKTNYIKAEILSVDEKQLENDETDFNPLGEYEVESVQEITALLLSGDQKGEKVSFKNDVSSNPLNIKVKKGDVLMLEEDVFKNGKRNYSVMDYYRVPILYWLFILFIISILLIGAKTGFRTLLALFISVFFIFYWFIPSVLKGSNPFWMAVWVAVFATILTLFLIAGNSKKTYSAILGTLSGIFMAVLLTYFFTHWAKLNGLCTEESRLLFTKHNDLDPLLLFYAGILIGSLGAVMDAAMSVASAVSEIRKTNKKADFNELLKGGLNVGRDIMGTMANTLVLAYVSVSLPLLLLYYDFGGNFNQFINFDFVADEIIRSLAGSIGLIASIPITAFFAASLESANIEKLEERK